MLCDTDRWHVSYYFLCEWLSLSHGRWLEYSFHFDNSADYPQQSQSCILRDLYVKIPVSYQPQQQSGKCPWRFTQFVQIYLCEHNYCRFDIFGIQSSCFSLRVVQECKAETLHERTFPFPGVTSMSGFPQIMFPTFAHWGISSNCVL